MINLLLRAAPRPLLRRLELGAIPCPKPSATQTTLQQLRSLRIAFVKQDICAAMPSLPGKHPITDFLKSASGHTGCLSLLNELGAELILLREARAPECQIWAQKVSFDPDPARLVALYRQEAREAPFRTPWGLRSRHESAVAPESVDWGRFDVVVCLDIPVPETIVRAHPQIVWAYMITETAMPIYRESRRRPLFGYHLFLNQKCRLHSVRPANRWHEIDFPWAFQSPECYAELPAIPGNGVCLDPHTPETPSVRTATQALGLKLRMPRGLLAWDWIQELRASRYLVRLAKNRNWGNLPIEAACVGSLVLADPFFVENPAPLLLQLTVRDEAEAIRRLRALEKDTELRCNLHEQQAARVRELAFARPLREFGRKVEYIRRQNRW